MSLKDKFKRIGKAAFPVLTSGLLGPAAPLVSAIVGPLIFGDKEQRDADAIIQHIVKNQSPELFAKLKAAELEAEARLKEFEIDVFALEVEDRQSARDMYVKTRTIMVPILASLIILGFFSFAGLFVWSVVIEGKVVPESTQLGMIISAVMASLYAVINFFFGSSLGSKEKTGLLGGR